MKKYLSIIIIIISISFGIGCVIIKENKIKSKERVDNEYTILDFRMVDKSNGWAIAKEGILNTENKGNSWNNTNLKDQSLNSILDSANNKENREIAYEFFDKNIAYVAYRKENNIDVSKTMNRGSKWEKSTFELKNFKKDNQYNIYLKVVDKYNSFILISTIEGKDKFENSLYRTIDGGKNWTYIYNENSKVQAENNISIDYEKRNVHGIEFKDKSLGWCAIKNNNDYPIIYRTKNSGMTWNLEKLPVSNEYKNNKNILWTTYTPIFTASSKKIYLPVVMNDGKNSTIIFYKSNNKGESWASTIPIEMKLSTEIDYGIDGEDVLWIKDSGGDKIYRLQNDDKDLQEIKSDMELKSKRIQFINKNNGVMLMENKIYVTKDKGITWNILK